MHRRTEIGRRATGEVGGAALSDAEIGEIGNDHLRVVFGRAKSVENHKHGSRVAVHTSNNSGLL
tara:strand:- start:316 stop:507 length:192 start_codon:yes stop_codon:yes gene_type:complete